MNIEAGLGNVKQQISGIVGATLSSRFDAGLSSTMPFLRRKDAAMSNTRLDRWAGTMVPAIACLLLAGSVPDLASAQNAPGCTAMRRINVGVSVAPPNVVHTSPYVAKELGFFAKRCIDANIVQFDGGQSATSNAAAAQGSAIISVSDVAIGRGMKVQQIWGLAPRAPQAYMVSPSVKTAADLKGKRLSATGGGVGGFNWRMGREVLKTAGLTVDDAQFIASATAGRLPGLLAGQIDAVFLHPEDVYLAKKQKPNLNVLVQIADLLPNYMFNAYGASADWIARDRPLLRDTVAAMIEANRMMFRDKAKVVPIIEKATDKPKDAVEYAIDVLVKNCVWSVNSGFDPKRTQWSIDNSIENGDIEPDKKPSIDQVANMALANEAVEAAGGKITIGNCSD
jgi:NitT/TauT family transport system substrate-binding protein